MQQGPVSGQNSYLASQYTFRETIVLDDNYQPKTRQSKYWIAGLHLKRHDREILLNPTGWLNDAIIDGSQKLLSQQFPTIPGFQSVALGLICTSSSNLENFF